MIKNKKTAQGKKVFVAMSGGVDSSVAAGLLKDAGYDVTGVTMCFSISHPNSKRPSCCGVEGIEDARRAAQILDIPHYVLDFAADINDFIIEDFVNEYINGRTPNPCVRCNQYLKFVSLYNKVISSGADYLATGHYAKICYNSDKARYEMKKATDVRKDQSYFLYGIKKEILPRLLFPLGDLTKDQVRDLARRYNLNTAEKPESQDICFVPDNDYKQFIKDRIGESAFVPGLFKNEKGEVLGEHNGIMNYTIGQRDKLGLALGFPAYVYKIEKETNTVYVGPSECRYSNGFLASQFNLLSLDMVDHPLEVDMQIRYNAPEVKGIVFFVDENYIRVEFKEPQPAVTPGQSAVFYDKDVIAGGAVIDAPLAG